MKRIAICGLLIALVLALFAPGAIASDPSTAAGAYTSSGAAAAGTNYYLADGYSGYDVWVAVRDVSGVHNNIRCYVYYGSQQFYLTNVAEANSRCTFHVNPYLPANTSFSMKVVGLNGSIVAERSMYAGGDGSCGSGAVYLRNSQDPNPYYFFSDVYSETGANAYIEVFNQSGYGNIIATAYTMGPNGWSIIDSTMSLPAVPNQRLSFSYAGSTAKNRVVYIETDGTCQFMAERSWTKGAKITSCGGTWIKQSDRICFAEGWSNYPTWAVTGWSDGLVGNYRPSLGVNITSGWNNGSRTDLSGGYDSTSNSLNISGVPSSTNYGILADTTSFTTNPSFPWYYCTERTTQYGQRATSSEGRNVYENPGNNCSWLFAESYTGYDVYVSLSNFSGYSQATFHFWVTTSSTNNYSFDITVYGKTASVHLNNYVPGAQNCSIYVQEVNRRWPVGVETTSYFN